MTRLEVNKLLAMLKVNYSYSFKGMGKAQLRMMITSWTMALWDVDADLALMAAMKLISSSKWMPTAAEIRQKVKDICEEARYTLAEMETAKELGIADNDYGRRRMLESIAERASRYRGDGDAEMSLSDMLTTDNMARVEGGEVRFALTDINITEGEFVEDE